MIAAEWEMQQPYIKPDTMPIVRKRQSSFTTPCIPLAHSCCFRIQTTLQTRLATTIMDRLVEGKPEIRHALTLEMLDYIETDTVWCVQRFNPSAPRH